MIDYAVSFPKLRKAAPTGIKAPPLNTPLQKTVIFAAYSAHFDNILQAERELAGIVKVMKQFPQLRVTIQGNLADSFVPPALLGFGPAARSHQNTPFPAPITTTWPKGMESYSTNGQVMDNRARTIAQYLRRNGIAARRISTQRGQYTRQRSVTIIFSN